jgi:ribosomal protein S18 acetylase RimI-like enzyme
MATGASFEIVRGRPEDAADIIPLMIAFNDGEGIPWRAGPMGGAFDQVLRDSSLGLVLVARDSFSGAIAGYGVATFGFDIEFAGRDAFVTELFVAGRYRGRGAGKALLVAFLTLLQEAGAAAVHLVVRPENERARRLYEAQGFRVVPRTLMTRPSARADPSSIDERGKRQAAPLPVVVRNVRIDDAEEIAGILNPIIEAGAYTVLDGPISVDAQRQFIDRFPSRGVFLVAADRTDGRILGLQSVEGMAPDMPALSHVASIGTYVGLDVRRRGVARELFRHTFVAAAAHGFEKLFTYVRADNPAALAAYVAHGFRVVGTASRHARIQGQYVDEILIERLLPPPAP